jgi:hypothetical protein
VSAAAGPPPLAQPLMLGPSSLSPSLSNPWLPTRRAPRRAFLTLSQSHSSEAEVKKSRFVAHAWPCASADEAMQLMATRRDPSASHNCWAYRVGQQYRSSDDGEPGGTAGRPILAAIEGEGLDGVAVLVIRQAPLPLQLLPVALQSRSVLPTWAAQLAAACFMQ